MKPDALPLPRKFAASGLHFEITDRTDDGVLDAFYPAFDSAFVLDSEKERIEGFVACLTLNAGADHDALQARYGPFRELILIARDTPDGPVLGGANFLVLALPADGAAPVQHTVNLNYLFVDPKHRGRGLSRRIMRACSERAATLARSWHGAADAATGLMFLEVNDPLRLTPEQYRIDSEHAGIDQVARLAYWARVGAAVLDLAYTQPALSAEQEDDHTLALAVIGSPHDALPATTVRRHLERFFAISVLKGAPVDSSPSAARQLEELLVAAGNGDPVALLDLGAGLPRVARQVTRKQDERCASLPQALTEDGVAFFTLSMLISSAQINSLIAASGGPDAMPVWDQALLKGLELTFADSADLQRAIQPMFDDIADRERNLFIKDFLLDTRNDALGAPPPLPPGIDPRRDRHWHNVCADIDLGLGQNLHWKTEGVESTLALKRPIRFFHVLCRAFWMAHSNHSLSFHLSFEVPYRRDISDYYGLSMLLKAFYPTEGTEWVIGSEGWMAARAGATPVRLLTFIEELFERHAQHLFARLPPLDEPVAKAMAARAWQRLVLDDAYATATQDTKVSAWRRSPARRLLVVLRDRRVFEAIDRSRREPDLLRALEPMKAPAGQYDAQSLQATFHARAAALSKAGGPAIDGDELLLTVFLSGFLQNIVDFLEQDGLEVHDGLTPLYPPGDASASNEGYFVHATPKAVFEAVSTSRSLDRAGRTWLGTCPYMFLVHITAFHNEAVVRAYEVRVSELIDKLSGLLSGGRPAGRKVAAAELTRAYEEIKAFRLQTFEQVHKHLSFNIFRYETERTFFNSIADVRGIDARRSYWDGVLQHLTETVDSLKDDRAARNNLRLAWLAFILALTGLAQLWLELFPLDSKAALFPLHGVDSLLAGGAVTVALAGVFWIYTRRWFKL